MAEVNLIQGDCLEVLKGLESESYSAVLCDPPYGLKFMGKEWDRGVPSAAVWAEALRVLKPGAVLLAFGGTRTWHRLAVNIEDAGFELADTLMYLYGAGFPKSHNISKAIDKAAGVPMESRGHFEFTAADAENVTPGAFRTNEERKHPGSRKQPPVMPDARIWDGYGTAMKPAWEPCLLFRKPRNATYAQCAVEHGTACLNIGGTRIGTEARTDSAQRQQGPYTSDRTWSVSETPARIEPRTYTGRWPSNLMFSHTADCVQTGVRRVKGQSRDVLSAGGGTTFPQLKPINTQRPCVDADGMETVAEWACAEGCPVAELSRQSGVTISTGGNKPSPTGTLGGQGIYQGGDKRERWSVGDKGTAARFFYCAKSSRRERDMGLGEVPLKAKYKRDGSWGSHEVFSGATGDEAWKAKNPAHPMRNPHPTCKPLAITEYLARLIVPPPEYRDDAQLLIPFAGVMSEGIGAVLAGWRNITAIELQEEYCEIGRLRIDWWTAKMEATGLTDPRAILKACGLEAKPQLTTTTPAMRQGTLL